MLFITAADLTFATIRSRDIISRRRASIADRREIDSVIQVQHAAFTAFI